MFLSSNIWLIGLDNTYNNMLGLSNTIINISIMPITKVVNQHFNKVIYQSWPKRRNCSNMSVGYWVDSIKIYSKMLLHNGKVMIVYTENTYYLSLICF